MNRATMIAWYQHSTDDEYNSYNILGTMPDGRPTGLALSSVYMRTSKDYVHVIVPDLDQWHKFRNNNNVWHDASTSYEPMVPVVMVISEEYDND